MAFDGIRRRLALLILAIALPAVVVAGGLLAYEHQRDRERVERDTIATARALVNAVDRELVGIQAAARVLSASHRAQAGDLAAFYSQAQEVVANGIGVNVVLSDAAGRQLLNTLRPLGEPLPMHGNLQQHRAALASGRPVVSDLYLGGVLRRPVMSIDVPVFRDDRAVYVLSVGEVPDRFRAILSEQKLPAGWIGAVFDRNGTVVARTHEHERFVGGKGAPELVARMLEQTEGALDAVTLEGIAVVSLFSRSPVSGWSVALGIPRGDLTAGLWRRSLLAALAAASILALGLGLAWAIGGRTARSVGEAMARAARMISSAEHRAQHDPLTGLANSALFREVTAHRSELCKRTGAKVSVLFIDLDGFKAVNDAHGHEVGDELLRAVAGRVKDALRASDLAARMGGDEFAVLLEGTGGEAAEATAAKLSGLLAQPYRVSGRELAISASIGVASCPHSGSSAEELIRRADEAMYRVKAAARRGTGRRRA